MYILTCEYAMINKDIFGQMMGAPITPVWGTTCFSC